MALTSTEKKEIEVLIRKEIKDFLGSNTVQQHEQKIIDMLSKELKRDMLRFNDYFKNPGQSNRIPKFIVNNKYITIVIS